MQTPVGPEAVYLVLRENLSTFYPFSKALWEVEFKGHGLTKLMEGIWRQLNTQAVTLVFVYPNLQWECVSAKKSKGFQREWCAKLEPRTVRCQRDEVHQTEAIHAFTVGKQRSRLQSILEIGSRTQKFQSTGKSFRAPCFPRPPRKAPLHLDAELLLESWSTGSGYSSRW